MSCLPPTYLQVQYNNNNGNAKCLTCSSKKKMNTHTVHQDGKCYQQFNKQPANTDCSRCGGQSVRSLQQMNKSFCQVEARRYKLNFTPVCLLPPWSKRYISLWTDAGDSSSTPSVSWLFSYYYFSCYYSNINDTVISLFVDFYSFKNNC